MQDLLKRIKKRRLDENKFFNNSSFEEIDLLKRAFSDEQTRELLKRRSKRSDAFYFSGKRFPLSRKYIKGALIWYTVLRQIKFNGSSISELLTGNSCQIDLALSFLNYKGKFYKIDRIPIFEECKINKKFETMHKRLDVLSEPKKIPSSDLIILNHAVDDLFIGLWADDNKIDFFNKLPSIKEDKQYWDMAMKNKEKYLPLFVKFAKTLVSKLKNNGYIILSDYISAYEIKFKLYERTLFIDELNNILKKEFIKMGLKMIKVNLQKDSGLNKNYNYIPSDQCLVFKKLN